MEYTVTISLRDYEHMKAELEELKREKKTLVEDFKTGEKLIVLSKCPVNFLGGNFSEIFEVMTTSEAVSQIGRMNDRIGKLYEELEKELIRTRLELQDELKTPWYKKLWK